MEIRKMQEGDIPQIAEIEREAFPTHSWSEALFYEELKDESKHYIVAIGDEGDVYGYGGFAQVLDEGHIMNIAVRKDKRREGLGRKVLECLLNEAEKLKITQMTLDVAVENIPAITLYKSFGFVSFGVRPNYYGKGEHAEIMWKAMEEQ